MKMHQVQQAPSIANGVAPITRINGNNEAPNLVNNNINAVPSSNLSSGVDNSNASSSNSGRLPPIASISPVSALKSTSFPQRLPSFDALSSTSPGRLQTITVSSLQGLNSSQISTSSSGHVKNVLIPQNLPPPNHAPDNNNNQQTNTSFHSQTNAIQISQSSNSQSFINPTPSSSTPQVFYRLMTRPVVGNGSLILQQNQQQSAEPQSTQIVRPNGIILQPNTPNAQPNTSTSMPQGLQSQSAQPAANIIVFLPNLSNFPPGSRIPLSAIVPDAPANAWLSALAPGQNASGARPMSINQGNAPIRIIRPGSGIRLVRVNVPVSQAAAFQQMRQFPTSQGNQIILSPGQPMQVMAAKAANSDESRPSNNAASNTILHARLTSVPHTSGTKCDSPCENSASFSPGPRAFQNQNDAMPYASRSPFKKPVSPVPKSNVTSPQKFLVNSPFPRVASPNTNSSHSPSSSSQQQQLSCAAATSPLSGISTSGSPTNCNVNFNNTNNNFHTFSSSVSPTPSSRSSSPANLSGAPEVREIRRALEKKRREEIKDGYEQLKQVVPSLRLQIRTPPVKILEHSLEYIYKLHRQRRAITKRKLRHANTKLRLEEEFLSLMKPRIHSLLDRLSKNNSRDDTKFNQKLSTAPLEVQSFIYNEVLSNKRTISQAELDADDKWREEVCYDILDRMYACTQKGGFMNLPIEERKKLIANRLGCIENGGNGLKRMKMEPISTIAHEELSTSDHDSTSRENFACNITPSTSASVKKFSKIIVIPPNIKTFQPPLLNFKSLPGSRAKPRAPRHSLLINDSVNDAACEDMLKSIFDGTIYDEIETDMRKLDAQMIEVGAQSKEMNGGASCSSSQSLSREELFTRYGSHPKWLISKNGSSTVSKLLQKDSEWELRHIFSGDDSLVHRMDNWVRQLRKKEVLDKLASGVEPMKKQVEKCPYI